MDKSLFKYVWQHSRRDQILICVVVLLSLPFYYLSLDLPRRIVNEAIEGGAFSQGNETVPFFVVGFDLPSWLGGAHIQLFDGIQVGRIELLFGLSSAFLFYVLVNGAFKYWINLAKGALGERMLRRLRFELINLIMRFKPEALRRVKAAEIATIVKDEVEPIGGFIGDAFVLPIFLGTQAATALCFIIIQSEWLGLMAAVMVCVQLIVIPRLRRKLLVLSRERQLVSRRLAGRIGEVFDGQETMRLHHTADWERADIGDRLYKLFSIRYQIYKRKFIVKFLNNLLAQMTPFLFYAIGGYFAVTGRMNIGQLVAVIAAYRDLPPPLKELIDWDQQRLDVQVKYDQVVQQFAPERLMPAETDDAPEAAPPVLGSPLLVSDLKILDVQGMPLINDISCEVPLPGTIAIVGESVGQASALARLLAQPERCAVGHIRAGDIDLTTLKPAVRARLSGYVSNEPVLFSGTIRENLIYGLKSRHIKDKEEPDWLRLKRQLEARKTGNPLVTATDDWLSCQQAGVAGGEELDLLLLTDLRAIGLGDDLYRFGLFQSIDPERYPAVADGLVEARRRLRNRLQDDGASRLVEIFDPALYNTQATVAENLLFGVPLKPALTGAALARHSGFRQLLKAQGLTDILVDLGGKIAETMVEIFRDLTAGHPLFDRFSFVSAEDLGDYANIVNHWTLRRGRLPAAERVQLIGLTLAYIEPRHRLGLLDDDIRARIVAMRGPLRALLETEDPKGIEFYERDRFCAAAPVRDNILFGKIDLGIASARDRVAEAIRAVVGELDLRQTIERIGLWHHVGTAGRLLTGQQRVGIDLVRNLVKGPEILIIDGAFSVFSPLQQRALRQFLFEQSRQRGMTLIVVVAEENEVRDFDYVIRLSSGAATVERLTDASDGATLEKWKESAGYVR